MGTLRHTVSGSDLRAGLTTDSGRRAKPGYAGGEPIADGGAMNFRASLRSSDMFVSLQRLSRVAQDHPIVGPYLEMVTRLPMYARLGADLARDPDVPATAKASLVAAGAYAISPIDLVP